MYARRYPPCARLPRHAIRYRIQNTLQKYKVPISGMNTACARVHARQSRQGSGRAAGIADWDRPACRTGELVNSSSWCTRPVLLLGPYENVVGVAGGGVVRVDHLRACCLAGRGARLQRACQLWNDGRPRVLLRQSCCVRMEPWAHVHEWWAPEPATPRRSGSRRVQWPARMPHVRRPRQLLWQFCGLHLEPGASLW